MLLCTNIQHALFVASVIMRIFYAHTMKHKSIAMQITLITSIICIKVCCRCFCSRRRHYTLFLSFCLCLFFPRGHDITLCLWLCFCLFVFVFFYSRTRHNTLSLTLSLSVVFVFAPGGVIRLGWLPDSLVTLSLISHPWGLHHQSLHCKCCHRPYLYH